MINKKNLWFLTLFSLVLVLSIYYVTMPNELLQSVSESSEEEQETDISITETSTIETMKIEDEEEVNEQIAQLEETLTDLNISSEEKNAAYEEIKSINENSGKAETIEKQIKEEYSCDTFTKIENTEVRVVVDGCEQSKTLANNIMRLVQEQFDSKMYISVQFQ
jgi:stage III sporulation protein AH